uniref:Serotransferrin n=1 Tax=Neogobius melanostomus TaxID=47308 RepID=A0A8C6WNU5_9GOBI
VQRYTYVPTLGNLSFAVPTTTIKWCVISELELRKCNDLAVRSPAFTCVGKMDHDACITAIKAGEADAVTLADEYIYKAGLRNYDLVPIIAEDYRRNAEACSYSVAVAKKGTGFGLKDLKGKKSCHTGLGTSEGWIFPIGTLLSKGWMSWGGADNQPLLQAVSDFFSASCVPGASGYQTLCQLCKGDCSASSANEYFGGAGAFKCLAEGAGQVAFMNPADIPASERNNYELLCGDTTRMPVENFKTCNLGEQLAHAVVTRRDDTLSELIWTSLTTVRAKICCLVTRQSKQPRDSTTTSIRWCAVGPTNGPETAKCDLWSGNSFQPESGTPAIECQTGSTVEECFKKIMRQEADAIAVDGGQVYTAGKCGLVPAMVEQYDEGKCSTPGTAASSYTAVAVIKKGSGVTWGNLKGKRSCHTGIGRTAGWNIPMGHIHKKTNNCDFTQFFSSGCAPGADPTSPFCRNCKGSGRTVGDEAKCKPSADELYYGYAGAFRCLAEGAGDVAFIKHTIVGENTNGNGPDWARGLRSEEFELICPGKDGSVPINDYESCNLATVPAHAVMTRLAIKGRVVDVLKDQQARFGRHGSSDNFRLFESVDGKNLLFKDSTKCLQDVQTDSYESFLGQEYMTAMKSLRQCSDNTPDLEKSCTFQSCQ